MLVYETYGTESLFMNIMLLILVGILVNGPYALITTGEFISCSLNVRHELSEK